MPHKEKKDESEVMRVWSHGLSASRLSRVKRWTELIGYTSEERDSIEQDKTKLKLRLDAID